MCCVKWNRMCESRVRIRCRFTITDNRNKYNGYSGRIARRNPSVLATECALPSLTLTRWIPLTREFILVHALEHWGNVVSQVNCIIERNEFFFDFALRLVKHSWLCVRDRSISLTHTNWNRFIGSRWLYWQAHPVVFSGGQKKAFHWWNTVPGRIRWPLHHAIDSFCSRSLFQRNRVNSPRIYVVSIGSVILLVLDHIPLWPRLY